jgi:hypothetical protein
MRKMAPLKLPKGTRRTVSHLILPAAVGSTGVMLWALCHATDFAREPYLPALALLTAVLSAHLLRASWQRQLRAAFQEGFADGYLRRVSDELESQTVSSYREGFADGFRDRLDPSS